MNPEIAARLASLNIQIMAGANEYSMLARDVCVAMVHRTPDGYSAGGTGIMTETGLAYLVWRDGRPFLSGKGGGIEARPEQVETMLKFSSDIASALK